MPIRGVAKGSKRDRQFEHIKQRLKARGGLDDLADEIAARTVNKERALHGETRTVLRTSVATCRRAGAAAFAQALPGQRGGPVTSSTTTHAGPRSRSGRG